LCSLSFLLFPLLSILCLQGLVVPLATYGCTKRICNAPEVDGGVSDPESGAPANDRNEGAGPVQVRRRVRERKGSPMNDESDEEDDGGDGEWRDIDESEEQQDPRTGLMALCPAWDHTWLCRIERIDDDGVSVQLWNKFEGTEQYLPMWDWTRAWKKTETVLMSTVKQGKSRKNLTWVSTEEFLRLNDLSHVGLVLDASGQPALEKVRADISAAAMKPI
jgi:hypothetical protein